MKMKVICEETGLTSRAVRVYIEEGLISPTYTENYLGRRTFKFAQEDVSALQNIATLRKYGFSIAEIREILSDPQNSISIIQLVFQHKKSVSLNYILI